jgi:hypothetical protein
MANTTTPKHASAILLDDVAYGLALLLRRGAPAMFGTIADSTMRNTVAATYAKVINCMFQNAMCIPGSIYATVRSRV